MPRKPRTVFTQEQSMINHYEVVLIEAAASETGLDIQTIKITNEKARHKPPTSRSVTRILTVKRSLSDYNVFMKEFFQKTEVDGN
ncbi:10772_t:CDS:2 [Paraglomus brasilianum]|uniref:10772_t:CDS:1 n=1 Tax=Paraglomus brasilianum TaxID=144538 RepID=A0A9N9G5R9_9GLOM|nr:10772_t:CDS:2 [Paraglomus brasilianum]